jgi:hypothetical protein
MIILETIVKIIVLKNRSSWADWFDTLYKAAGNKGIWDKINLFNNKVIEINIVAPPRPSPIINKLILKEIEDYYTRYQVKAEN